MRAAIEIGVAYGVDASEPVLLHETNNTVVWLRPSPVVAKVATRADSKVDVRLEHAIGSELAALGADVAHPFPGAEPVEHPSTGFVVTLWEWLERVNGEVPGRSLSSSLAALHAALANTHTKLPSFRAELMRARVTLDDDTAMAAVPPRDRTFIRSVYDAGLAELEGPDLDRQRLHGEPHEGNRVLTAQGVRWIDFESCCVGPLEWDLAFHSAEVSATFSEVDGGLLRRLIRLNRARVATWCWATARIPEMRRQGELHVQALRAEPGRP
ncbi:MAG TPA: phosphotransferase [Acidimicrobiales bacterium]|nr:phosphotransferase [Acidimicrobiales bacterium]